MKVVGIFLVKNEDVYIEQAIRNVAEFCDLIYVDDNQSTDNTPAILQSLAGEFKHLKVRTIEDTVQSNENLVQYFGTDTWIFAVDGDELYDKSGLARYRKRLESGEFDKSWLILGNCLHVTEINSQRKTAKGFMAPPSKSMTKLYNFSLIDDFPVTDERLHGTPVFKDGGDAPSRWLHLYKDVSWEESDFRCLHTAFVTRTSTPKSQARVMGIRLNPPQIYTLKKIWKDYSFFYALPRAVKLLVEIVLRRDSRVQRYKLGSKIEKDTSSFF